MSTLREGLKSAIRYAEADNGRRRPQWVPPSAAEIKRMREDLGLSQAGFSERFGISLVSLRKWEQGRTEPEQVTCMVLRMIQADQRGVQTLISKAREKAKKGRTLQKA